MKKVDRQRQVFDNNDENARMARGDDEAADCAND